MANLSNGQLTTQAKRLLKAADLTPVRVRSTWGLTTVTFADETERDAGALVLAAAGWTFSASEGFPWLVSTSPDSARFND
jgi:hypothetical protein